MSVDYFEELVAPKMGVSIEWVGPLPIARMYQYLDTAEVDAIFVVVKNPDREKRYLFASEPYCRGHASLWVLKESPLDELTRTEDILGWTIGFVEGSVVNGFLSHDKIRIENVHSEDYKRINFDKLLAKRLDAIYDHNEYTLAYESTKMGIRDRLRVILLPIDQSSYYTAFAKTKRGIELLSRYDTVNAGIPVGAVDAIMRRYTGN